MTKSYISLEEQTKRLAESQQKKFGFEKSIKEGQLLQLADGGILSSEGFINIDGLPPVIDIAVEHDCYTTKPQDQLIAEINQPFTNPEKNLILLEE